MFDIDIRVSQQSMARNPKGIHVKMLAIINYRRIFIKLFYLSESICIKMIILEIGNIFIYLNNKIK